MSIPTSHKSTMIPSIDYLVTCRGYLRYGMDRLPRKDALARIVRATLLTKAGSTRKIHLLFEDQCLVTISHVFLSSWGRGQPRDYPMDRFVELLGRALRDARLAPVKDKHPAPQGCSVVRPPCSWRLTEQLWPIVCEATGGVFALEEEGFPLSHSAPGKVGSTMTDSSTSSPVLFMIGGVRDVLDQEAKAVQEICKARNIDYSTVSLGKRAELTSKCIKALEALDAAGRLADNLWRARTSTTSGEKQLRSYYPTRMQVADIQPLHVVVEVDAFKATPAVAVHMADVFFRSGEKSLGATLSLLDSDGKVLTITWRHVNEQKVKYNQKVLSEDFEKTAEKIVKAAVEQLDSGDCTITLDELVEERRSFQLRRGRELLVLSLDSSSEDILDFHLPPHAAFEDTMSQHSDAVMLILSDKEVQGAAVRGSLGCDLAVVPAWASILHGEGLLAPAIRAKRDEVAKASSVRSAQPAWTDGRPLKVAFADDDELVKTLPRRPSDGSVQDVRQGFPGSSTEPASPSSPKKRRVWENEVSIKEEAREEFGQKQPSTMTFAEIMKDQQKEKKKLAEAMAQNKKLLKEEAQKTIAKQEIQRKFVEEESEEKRLAEEEGQSKFVEQERNVVEEKAREKRLAEEEAQNKFAEVLKNTDYGKVYIKNSFLHFDDSELPPLTMTRAYSASSAA